MQRMDADWSMLRKGRILIGQTSQQDVSSGSETEYQPYGWREPFGQINFGDLFYRTIKMRKTG